METLRAGEPRIIDGIVLIPVERQFLHAVKGEIGCRFTAFKEPYAVIVCDAQGERAFTPDAAAVSLDVLKQEIDDLDEILERYAR
jgi:hypothetical protein